MVMGLDKAKQILKKNKSLKAYLIFADEQGKLKTESIRMPQ